jgi:hypothetical protein
MPDARAAQVARLKDDNRKLKQRLAELDVTLEDFEKFRTLAPPECPA